MMKSDRSFEEWIQKDPVPFCFDSESSSLALIGHNDSFTTQPLLVPFAVRKLLYNQMNLSTPAIG